MNDAKNQTMTNATETMPAVAQTKPSQATTRNIT